MTEENTPQISKTAFSCPHCGAYTSQSWYRVNAKKYNDESRHPSIPKKEWIEKLRADKNFPEEEQEKLVVWVKKMIVGKPFFEILKESIYSLVSIHNCNISECYNCRELSVWIHEKIVYPNNKIDIKPNNDLPDHIKKLFDEAREIIDLSPKGAAALLRLAIQHLCKELGESGKNIDQDIASLVGKGLNPIVQQALDVVRVVGNEAVHPGEINLDDNKDIAINLFGLVNLICEQMISHPKHVAALYDSLPQAKLAGIEQRNAKATKNKL